MLELILDLFFPKFCLGCHKFNTLLCENCYQKINFYPIKINKTPTIEHLENITVVAQYTDLIKKMIIALKYQGVKDLGKTFARMSYYVTNLSQIDLITAVPLHQKRQRQRGFNQAQEIAFELSKLTQIKYQNLLIRAKHLAPQAKIADKTQRLSRLKNTFVLNPAHLVAAINPSQGTLTKQKNHNWQNLHSQQTVLVVDDVTTTGATLDECARVLKTAGYKQVYGLAMAHGN